MNIAFPNESEEYRTARDRLLIGEIGLRRSMEAVASARRSLPPGGLVPEDYVFDTMGPDGSAVTVLLSELFAPDTDTLAIYNMMFPRHPKDERPGEPLGPCPSCAAFLDQLDGAIPHVEAGGLNFAVAARAPIEQVAAFGRARGWRHLRLLSSGGNSFKRDYHAEDERGDQQPMMTVFRRGEDGIRHFWSSEMLFAPPDPGQDPRHNGTLEPLWNLFDLTPGGRPKTWHEQLDYGCCKGPSS